MIILADSGSTKTHWSLISSQNVRNIQTSGLNPFFNGAELAEKEISTKQVLRQNQTLAEKVYFYGAGCGNDKNCGLMEKALQRAFTRAKVSVYSDLLGAARGLFLDQKGIACILGTGSNSGLYNGKRIVRTTPALGYILGDEGSGNHLGKRLLKAYLHQDLPAELTRKFREKHPESADAILSELYHHPYPNRYLAGFTHFLRENKAHPYLHGLLKDVFNQFLSLLKKHYPHEVIGSVRMTGSVARAFDRELKEAAGELNMEITHIDPSPMEGLIKYHQRELQQEN